MKAAMRYVGGAYRRVARFFNAATATRERPLCGWRGKEFRQVIYPEKPQPTLECPQCGSVERHRPAFCLLDRVLGKDNVTLHIAPESSVEQWLRSVSADYLSADLSSPAAMLHMDVTDMPLEDARFTLVWCSHVLEHIVDDSKAISEIYRVLRPGGRAVIQVPVYGATTYEDWAITSPEDRLKHFKQEDHVRLYGLDVADRLRSSGFEVDVMTDESVPEDKAKRYGLFYPSTREVFVCVKPSDLVPA